MPPPVPPSVATWPEHKTEGLLEELFITGSELYSSELTPPGFLVRSLIPDVGLGLLVGDPGEGKSWIAYELARACATGTPWMERSAPAADGQSLNVAVANYDQDSAELKRRCLKLTIPGNKLFAHTLGISSAGIPKHVLRLPQDEKVLREIMLRFDIRLLLIDSMRQAHEGDENSSQDMGSVMNALRVISAATRSFVLAIHHSNKIGGARGSGEIRAALDVEITAKAKKTKSGAVGSLTWGKTRGWAIPGKQTFGFEITDYPQAGLPDNQRTIVRFTESVPGLDTAEANLRVVVEVLGEMGGAAEPAELQVALGKRLDRLDLAAAVRLGKKRGVLVPAKLPGTYTNPRRIGLARKGA